jgi:hypothetical protein
VGGFLYTDDTAPNSGNAKLRIINSAATESVIDVYVEPFGSSPSGPPTISNISYIYPIPAQRSPTKRSLRVPMTLISRSVERRRSCITPDKFLLPANQNTTVILMNVCTNGECSAHALASITVPD